MTHFLNFAFEIAFICLVFYTSDFTGGLKNILGGGFRKMI